MLTMDCSLRCGNCGSAVSECAPLCLECGYEPVLGIPYPHSARLPEDDEGCVIVPEGDELEAAPIEVVLEALAYSAYVIGAAEAHLTSMTTERPPRRRRRKRRRFERDMRGDAEIACGAIEHAVCRMDGQLDELARRVLDDGVVDAEEFWALFPQAHWAALEFEAYLECRSAAEFDDVVRRRVRHRVATRTFREPALWAPHGAPSCRLAFNELLLEPVPTTVAPVRELVEVYPGGTELNGTLEALLMPSAWRRWKDLAMAPFCGALVWSLANPVAGLDFVDPAWEGDRRGACEAYAARMTDLYDMTVYAQPSQVGEFPAVRSSFVIVEDDGSEMVSHHRWVQTPERLYHIHGWAPPSAREYADAVQQVVEDFEAAA